MSSHGKLLTYFFIWLTLILYCNMFSDHFYKILMLNISVCTHAVDKYNVYYYMDNVDKENT